MSQFPQNPQGNFPPGNFPPGNYPPNMQPPYGGGMYQPPMQPRTSGAAITSLIMGILLCIPAITGLGAILFGIIGLGSTRKPGVRGKGLAITGLILGLLNLVGWGVFGGIMGVAWKATGPDRATAVSFVQDLCTGNVVAAQGLCDPTVSPNLVQADATRALTFGTATNYIPFGFPSRAPGGNAASVVSVTVTFSNGLNHNFIVMVGRSPTGSPVIMSWQLQ
jgi:hypothetical protein